MIFIAGGAVATFFLPEKIVIKRDEKVVYKDRVVEKEVVKVVDKIVEKEVEKVVHIKSSKTKITYPDGKIVETEIYESESEQVSRVRELEKERFEMQLAEVQKDYEKNLSYYKEHLNPKRFTVFAGGGTRMDDLTNYDYLVGMDAQLWGPFIVGMHATSRKDVNLTLGFRF